MLGIWQVYTWWLVLWRWTWPHAARATSNNITGPCHYYNSFRFTTFAHFTFAHVSVHCPFRHKERRETPSFARTAHKPFHLGQYRWPIRYKGRDSASWIGRKLPSIRPGATTVVALRSYDRIQHPNRPELQKKQRKKEKSMNQSESNSNDASTSARAKLFTNWSNNELNNLFNSKTFMSIRSWKKIEFRLHKQKSSRMITEMN